MPDGSTGPLEFITDTSVDRLADAPNQASIALAPGLDALRRLSEFLHQLASKSTRSQPPKEPKHPQAKQPKPPPLKKALPEPESQPAVPAAAEKQPSTGQRVGTPGQSPEQVQPVDPGRNANPAYSAISDLRARSGDKGGTVPEQGPHFSGRGGAIPEAEPGQAQMTPRGKLDEAVRRYARATGQKLPPPSSPDLPYPKPQGSSPLRFGDTTPEQTPDFAASAAFARNYLRQRLGVSEQTDRLFNPDLYRPQIIGGVPTWAGGAPG